MFGKPMQHKLGVERQKRIRKFLNAEAIATRAELNLRAALRGGNFNEIAVAQSAFDSAKNELDNIYVSA